MSTDTQARPSRSRTVAAGADAPSPMATAGGGNDETKATWFGMSWPADPSDVTESWRGLFEAPALWASQAAETMVRGAGDPAWPGAETFQQMMRASTAWLRGGSDAGPGEVPARPDAIALPGDGWIKEVLDYWIDGAQRQILFCDVMRKRGNEAIEHMREGKPPVLVFDYELIMDGHDLDRPTNYMLLRIEPEPGCTVDPKKRPYVIVDPRAGHGPGIGGMKEASQVGVAMRNGHPVYFVAFRPEPEPGQTIADIAWTEAQFLQKVTELHPEAEGKPVVVGNCQAGWAIMILAAAAPELFGVIGIAGSPLSYWAGIEGKNPMRYFGGLAGGSWLASFLADLGHDKVDGAHLVQNFENLNPANTLWGKQYNLYAKIDTEEERYLGFEKWWSGYFMMTKEEFRGIVDELFVGNKLTRGTIQSADRRRIDLKRIKAPIVVIASWGDNITPPPQALYWIADLYENEQEIVANEQTIIYTLDERIGHLGIFVSGKVAQKQHAEMANTIDVIDVLPPGLYEMILEEKTPEAVGAELLPGQYLVRFEARRISDILALGDGREHEKAFVTVNRLSEVNEGLYDIFVSPWVRLWSTEATAQALRLAHPMRAERYLLSDMNPAMWPVKAMAERVRENRRPTQPDNAFVTAERALSDQIVAALDGWRDLRDRMQELTFKAIYTSPWVEAWAGLLAPHVDARKPRARDERLEEQFQRQLDALAARETRGGFEEAVVRILLACVKAEQAFDVRCLRLGNQIVDEYPEFRRVGPQKLKEIMKEEAFMIRFDEERALATLPKLLPTERQRRDAVELVERVVACEGLIWDQSKAVLARIRDILGLLAADAAPGAEATAPVPEAPRAKAGGTEVPEAAAPSRRRKAVPGSA